MFSCPDCKSWEQEVIDLGEEIAYLKMVRYEDAKFYEEEIKNYQTELKRLNKRMQLLLGEEIDDEL